MPDNPISAVPSKAKADFSSLPVCGSAVWLAFGSVDLTAIATGAVWS